MKVVVDVGNSRIKVGVFQRDTLLYDRESASDKETFHEVLKQLFDIYPDIEHGILSSVRENTNMFRDLLTLFCRVIVVGPELKYPFRMGYATPETLGADRLVLAASALCFHPRSHVLVIDSGTCITYDFITREHLYLGGGISPGLRMRYRSLNEYTGNLPLLEPASFPGLIGNSTEESIHSGVIKGVVFEVDGLIDAYRKEYPDLTVILTGGDAHFFAKQLKNSIFAHSKFLLKGLNYLLEFNMNR